MVIKDKGRQAIEKKNSVLQRLQVEYVSIDSIQPNEYNPNRQSEHDFELLVRSMEEDGFTQPIVCQSNRVIVDGEHRWRAARQLGYQEIPVVFVEMSQEQMRISTLRHNRARGSEDVELTAQVLADLRELGALDWAADSLMMSDEDLNLLLADLPAPEALGADDFSEAWEPDVLGKEDIEADRTTEAYEVKAGRAKGEVMTKAMSAAAVEAARERERQLAAAHSEEERVMIKRDTRFFRLSLVFSGDEADVVKSVLGNRPAETILALCRQANAQKVGVV